MTLGSPATFVIRNVHPRSSLVRRSMSMSILMRLSARRCRTLSTHTRPEDIREILCPRRIVPLLGIGQRQLLVVQMEVGHLPRTALLVDQILLSSKQGTLSNITLSSGTIWGQGGCHSASIGVRDVISVLAITREPTSVTIGIGDSFQELRTHHKHGHVHFFEVPVQGSTGPVTLSMHGRLSTGPDLRDGCSPHGYTVFNCAAIQV